MLTIKDVSPTPMAGQYWAWLNPLSLLKVRYGAPGDIYNFILWAPGNEGATELNIIAPLNDNYRLLRWSFSYFNTEILKSLGLVARVGDVFELKSGKLAFVVESGEFVVVHSDERIDLMDNPESVVQRGPGPEDKTVKTRYERIIDEGRANLPLVRSVDRAILREKEQDLVRLSSTNDRPKSTTINNLQLLQSAEQERLYSMK
jgi:hypothetical protein